MIDRTQLQTNDLSWMSFRYRGLYTDGEKLDKISAGTLTTYRGYCKAWYLIAKPGAIRIRWPMNYSTATLAQ